MQDFAITQAKNLIILGWSLLTLNENTNTFLRIVTLGILVNWRNRTTVWMGRDRYVMNSLTCKACHTVCQWKVYVCVSVCVSIICVVRTSATNKHITYRIKGLLQALCLLPEIGKLTYQDKKVMREAWVQTQFIPLWHTKSSLHPLTPHPHVQREWESTVL